MRGDFSKQKKLKFRKVVYPLRMSPFGFKIGGNVFETILQTNVPGFVWMRWDFFEKASQISELQGTDAAPRARMQRRGHMGRAHYGASQSRPTEAKKIKSLRDLICFVCIILF